MLFSNLLNLKSLYAASPLGNINPPEGVDKLVSQAGNEKGAGLFILINNILKLAIGLAGVFAVAQLVAAGYMYLNAAGDPKKAEAAWSRIFYSILGLVVAFISFVAVNIFGRIIGVDLLQPKIQGP